MANTAYMYITKDIKLNEYEEIENISRLEDSKREFIAKWSGYNFLDEVITANPDSVAIHIDEMEDNIYIVYFDKDTKGTKIIEYSKREGDVYTFYLNEMPKYIHNAVKDIIELDDIIIKQKEGK